MADFTATRKIEELNHLKGLLNFRIGKQEQLLEKIVTGKWKSSQVSDKVLYALAKHDLKLLRENVATYDSQLANLRKSFDLAYEKLS